MYLSSISKVPLILSAIKSLSVASNVTSTAHAMLRNMRVAPTNRDTLRLLSSGVALWFFWQAPILGLVAQVALNTLFDGVDLFVSYQKQKALQPATSHNTHTLAGYLFKSVVFPLQMAERLHEIGAPAPLPATLFGRCMYGRRFFQAFDNIVKTTPQYERAHIFVNHAAIDALSVKRYPNSKRWLMVAGGNGDLYQGRLFKTWEKDSFYGQLAQKMEANILFFNYPGCGLSEGMASRSSMVATHRAVQRHLEDQKEALEIITYGWSMGGGVQGEAMAGYEPKEGVRYCRIKDRTFQNLSEAARGLMGPIGGFAARVSGWNINTLADSNAALPQIVMQTGHDGRADHDHVISKRAALTSGEPKGDLHFMPDLHHCGTPSEDSAAWLSEKLKEHLRA